VSFLRVFLIISFFFALHFFAPAQFSDKRARFHSIGLNIMGSYFNGDVASGPNTIRPGFGAQYMYKFAPGFSFAAGVNYVEIAGDDESNSSPSNPATANRYIRNLSFRNNMVEVFTQVRWDLFPNNDHYRKRPTYNIFVGIGLGLLYTNPQAKDSSGHWTDLRPLKTEGEKTAYSQYTGFIPVSIGVRYKISSNIDMEFEVTYRYTFSDYLDDVKGNYADPKSLSPEAAYFANRSAESINTFNNHSRDLNYIQNQLGYSIQTNDIGGQYIAGTGPGQSRGSKIGPDGYILAMLRFVYIIPEKGVSCPRYRD
jgi:hypothetical protein